jgi:hypothetical protein
LKILELAFGPAPVALEPVEFPSSVDQIGRLNWHQLQALAAQVLVDPVIESSIGPTGAAGGGQFPEPLQTSSKRA